MSNRTGGFDSHTLPPTGRARFHWIPRIHSSLLLVTIVFACATRPRAELPSGQTPTPQPEAVHATAGADSAAARDVKPTSSTTSRTAAGADVTGADLDAARPVLAVALGEATYYASKFDGRLTASGIRFHNSELFAAHREYPFGTVVRVTNLENERSVVLRVVDRGPNGKSERIQRTIIDVSQRAARQLDFLRAGRINVRVEVLEWGPGRRTRGQL